MIRPATAQDVVAVQAMIRELAASEDGTDLVATDEVELHDVLFGPESLASALIAVDDETGTVVGYTLWFPVYCTWRGVSAQIDDVYVRAEAAGRGHEKALLGAVARVCAERGYRVMQWWGLISSTSNTAFYEGFGADHDPDLTVFRLAGKPLADLAAEAGPRLAGKR
jgi:GNAT superfamily N-acetyltransferase